MTECCPLCGSFYASDDLVLLPDRHDVIRGALKARLTPKEFELFEKLYAARPKVVRNEALLDWMYQLEHDEPNIKTISVYVFKIRPKVKPLGVNIISHFNLGYSLTMDGPSRVVKVAA